MKLSFLLLLLAFTFKAAFAQDGQLARPTKIVTKQYFDDEHTYAIIKGVKTSDKIKYLFKPSEIVISRVHSKDESMVFFVSGIEVKNSNHPVLKYFEHRSKLKVNNRYFEHNIIPSINPNQIASLEFHEADEQSESYLEVKLLKKGEYQNKSVRYEVVPEKINYYDIDGKISERGTTPPEYTIERSKLLNGELKSETLCCKEAYEKYNDERFITGIRVIRTK